jgi:tungstate transport system ATP-binding protein
MSSPMIELQSASVHFGTVAALKDVSFALSRGDRVALVGANGSGKSTLLRAMHGLVPLAAGRRVVGEVPSPRVAMVFQHPFMLRTSTLSNVELGLVLQRMPKAQRRERAMRALERVGLAAESGRIARVLSAGQQQRAALARAWAVQPDVLLLDEPTASLDPTAKREVENLIAEFSAQGITMIMSSHNLGQVKRLADRVLYLEHGRVLADVSSEHFFSGPLPDEATLFLKGELPWV